jgi:hypothetical protein
MRTTTVVLAVALLTVSLPAQQPPAPGAGGRTFLLLVDSLHLDFVATPRTRSLLKQLTAVMVEGDHIGIATTGVSSVVAPPGQDPQRGDATIRQVVGSALRPARWLAEAQTPQGRTEIGLRARVSFLTALELLRSRDASRPAVLVYISDGHQRSTESLGGVAAGPDSPSQAFEALIDAANRGGVPIHTLSPRGLMESAVPLPAVDSNEWRAHVQQSRETLRALAERTGGVATIDPADLETGLRRLRDFARR